jgi:hypothetical protein
MARRRARALTERTPPLSHRVRAGRPRSIAADAVAERLEQRLVASPWDDVDPSLVRPEVDAAAEVAAFALGLSGRRQAARRGGRLSRLVTTFALAASLALTSIAAGCVPLATNLAASRFDVPTLPSVSATEITLGAPIRASPARFTDLVLLDPGSDAEPWAVLVPSTTADQPRPAPVLVDRQGSGLENVGAVYSLPAQPVGVGTRDGASVFLDPLSSATQTGSRVSGDPTSVKARVLGAWQADERFAAATRAIAGRPSLLDAAYNAEAAVAAGGTHTYTNGVVLRVDPDNPALQVVDRALLESGKPTRADDVVLVAVRAAEKALYEPGQVVNLRDVVFDKQQSSVDGQSTTFYVANAALQGARVEPTGARVDLQGLLRRRLQRTDVDLAIQARELSQQQPTPIPAPVQQPVVVNRYSGPSFIDDFLIWMWLTNSGFYRGPNVVVVNPPPSSTRPTGDYYYVPPSSSGSAAQGGSQSTALQTARNAVSGQAAGTGGGTAATAKAAADNSARVGAATAKAGSVAGAVSASSSGKSTTSVSVPTGSTSTAARSSGSVSAGARGSGSSGGFGSSGGGKGISGSGSS